MSLFSEIGEAVDEVLSDPDMNTADVRIRRLTGAVPGLNPYDDPVETFQVIKLSCVVFTKRARFSGGTLVMAKGDELTISPVATVIEENGKAVNRTEKLEIRSTDQFIIDGDVRRVAEPERIPAAGPDVSVWQVRVVE